MNRTGQNAIQARAVAGIRETAPPASTGLAVSWHPGHYVNLGMVLRGIDTLDTVLARMAEVATCAAVRGVYIMAQPGFFETTKNNYSVGYSRVDQLLSRAQELGLRLKLSLWKAAFSSASLDYLTTTTQQFPVYMATEGILQRNNAGTYSTITLWTAAGMDRYIALFDALASRYNGHSHFEGIFTTETSTQKDFTQPGSEYSDDAAVTQWIRLCQRVKLTWTRKNVGIHFNSAFGTDDRQIRFFNEGIAANKCMISGPDVAPDEYPPYGTRLGSTGQRIYMGLLGNATYPAHDFRGELAAGFEVQGPNLGGNHTPLTIDNDVLLDFIYDIVRPGGLYLRSHYNIWLYKTGIYQTPPDTDANDVMWNTAGYPSIKAYLSQNPALIPVVTAKPSAYAAVDTT